MFMELENVQEVEVVAPLCDSNGRKKILHLFFKIWAFKKTTFEINFKNIAKYSYLK